MIGFLREVLFENPLLLLLFEIVAMAVVIAWYRRDPESSRRRQGVIIALIVCVALVAVQHLVKTDRERIQEIVQTMAKAVDDGDVQLLGTYLDVDFQDRDLKKKEDWLQEVNQLLQRWQIDHVGVSNFMIDVQGDQAVAQFSARCDWRSSQMSQPNVYSTWKLGFVRRDDGWKLHRIIDGQVGIPGHMTDYKAVQNY